MEPPVYVAPKFWTRSKLTGLTIASVIAVVAALGSFHVPTFQTAANARLKEIADLLERSAAEGAIAIGSDLHRKTHRDAVARLQHAQQLLHLSNRSLRPSTVSDRLAWAYANETARKRALQAISETLSTADMLSADAKGILDNIHNRAPKPSLRL